MVNKLVFGFTFAALAVMSAADRYSVTFYDPVVINGTTLKPGDKIAASVTRTGTSYALKLTDSTTTGNNISVTKTCALATCLDTSAEWISERPSFSIGIVPQAHYNAFKLTSGAQTSGGKAGTIGTGPGVNSVTMIDSTQTYNLNTVSGLTGGNAFSTTWKNSY